MRKMARMSLACLLVGLACLEPYSPPSTKDLQLLVVDGFLNSGSGLARVKLSRSLPLDATTSYPAERSASVVIESESGTQFFLPPTAPGNYEAHRNDLHVGEAYKLLI